MFILFLLSRHNEFPYYYVCLLNSLIQVHLRRRVRQQHLLRHLLVGLSHPPPSLQVRSPLRARPNLRPHRQLKPRPRLSVSSTRVTTRIRRVWTRKGMKMAPLARKGLCYTCLLISSKMLMPPRPFFLHAAQPFGRRFVALSLCPAALKQ